MKNILIIYQTKNGEIVFKGDVEKETLWASQAQITELFGVDQSVVSKHIRNTFKDGEVDAKSNMQKMHIPNSDRPVTFYSLDVILSVGYRTNSKVAIDFRKWATKTLKTHIMQGYTINKKQIVKNYEAFLNAFESVKKLLPETGDIKTEGALELVKLFADAWLSIDAYDKSTLPKIGANKKQIVITAQELEDAIFVLKSNLLNKKEASELFAQERQKDAISGILGNVFQSIFGKDAYETIEEKAAHLLYFIVKNHPFSDGNKRSGAFAFVWYLNKTGLLKKDKITPEALEILKKWKNNEKVENSKAIYIEKGKIAETGDYKLSIDQYRTAINYSNAKWPMVELKELCEITTGRKDVNEGNPDGKYPFFTCAKENTFIDTFSFDTEALLIAGNGDVGAVKCYKGKFDAYQRTYVLSNFKNVNVKYLFQILNNSLKENMQLLKLGNIMPYIKLGMLQTFLVPLPPLEIQEQIVAELDGYAGIIAGAKQIAQSWKPKIDIDPEWEKMKLGDVCSFEYGGAMPEKNRVAGDFPVVGSNGIVGMHKDYLVKGPTIVVGRKGSAGEVNWIEENCFPIDTTYFVRIKGINMLDLKFLYFVLLDLSLQSLRSGGAVPGLNRNDAYEKEIPFPPLEIQKQIVEKIEFERSKIEGAKELIPIYREHIKNTIAKLWSE